MYINTSSNFYNKILCTTKPLFSLYFGNGVINVPPVFIIKKFLLFIVIYYSLFIKFIVVYLKELKQREIMVENVSNLVIF